MKLPKLIKQLKPKDAVEVCLYLADPVAMAAVKTIEPLWDSDKKKDSKKK